MRYFIPATDDEIYALIERYGFAALQPYRPGLPLATQSAHTSTPSEPTARASESPMERHAA